MPHSQIVNRLSVSDNPMEPAPAYKGKWTRNNKEGETLERDEYLLEMTRQWHSHVSINPLYDKTYLHDKARVLRNHLRLNSTQCSVWGLLTDAKCKELIVKVESLTGAGDMIVDTSPQATG